MSDIAYPNIAKAHIRMAYDNGGIHRHRSEETARRELQEFLPVSGYNADQLAAIDDWLGTLSEADDLETVICGSVDEADVLLATSPPLTNELLNDIFDKVC